MEKVSIPNSIDECTRIHPVAETLYAWSHRLKIASFIFVILSVFVGTALIEENGIFTFILCVSIGVVLWIDLYFISILFNAKAVQLEHTVISAKIMLFEYSRERTSNYEPNEPVAKPIVPKTALNSNYKICPQCGSKQPSNRTICAQCAECLY